MIRQIVFTAVLLLTNIIFLITLRRIIRYFLITRPAFPVREFGKRFNVMLNVAFGQTKIFRQPVIGFFHALVFWGFCVIIFGSIEMVIDGVMGYERSLRFFGLLYDIIIASGDIFGLLITIAIVIFLSRRLFLHIRRFEGIEMKPVSHIDATIALSLILLLMLSLLGLNSSYIQSKIISGDPVYGYYPVSNYIAPLFRNISSSGLGMIYEGCWWSHIILIFLFVNILPYSKHFHVFMSVPNVFLSRLDPLGKLPNMNEVTREVKIMLDPAAPVDVTAPAEHFHRFGIRDAEDVSWKNYFDSLSCTECGRCTAVCPASITGKRLSPRKIIMDVRARMKEKGPGMLKYGKEYTDNKSLIRDYITEEELWACTTCNACAKECPININHPTLIVDLRRYLVMEEGSAPGLLKSMFNYIENNGAPWQFSRDDRLLWASNLAIRKQQRANDPVAVLPEQVNLEIPVMADLYAEGKKPEYLFWVGCSGAFDERYKKVVQAFAKILSFMNVSFAVLGKEETCTGDPARRSGNEMLYQMQAFQNIGLFRKYDVKKILTTCPHCYNIFRNEYPDLGGNYDVINYLQFIESSLNDGKLTLDPSIMQDLRITYHDPCYLGRGNNIYSEPRSILKKMTPDFAEIKRHKSFALCCGGGGGQMFKEAEKGLKEVYSERTEEALATEADIIATACPFCMNMISDGIKYKNRENEVKNLDIAELIVQTLDI